MKVKNLIVFLNLHFITHIKINDKMMAIHLS
jgi:hypothetical protein